MGENIKRVLIIIGIFLILGIVGIGVYNIIIKSTVENIVNKDNTDYEYNDPSIYEDAEVNHEIAFRMEPEDLKAQTILECNNLKLGINTEIGDYGIVLNPSYEGLASHYIFFIETDTGNISTSSFEICELDDGFEDSKYLYGIEANLKFYKATYQDDTEYGIKWLGDSSNPADTLTIRVMDYDTFEIVGVYTVDITSNGEDDGKYGLSNLTEKNVKTSNTDASEALEILNQEVLGHGWMTPKNPIYEEVDSIYYISMTDKNGYDRVYTARIDVDNFPMKAITFVNENVPRYQVTIYLTLDNELFGYNDYSYDNLRNDLEKEYGIYQYE